MPVRKEISIPTKRLPSSRMKPLSCVWAALMLGVLGIPASITLAAPAPPATASAAIPTASPYFSWRRQQFARLNQVGHRISVAAASDCPGATASLGFAIDHPGQYLAADRPKLGFGTTDQLARISAISPESPAARAGLHIGDRLVLAAAPPSQLPPTPTFAGVEAAITAIDALPVSPNGTITLHIERDGTVQMLGITPSPGCGGWFDLRQSNRANASSTRRWIQLTDRMIGDLTDDDALAFIIGHEMAHRAMRLVPGHIHDSCKQACEDQADRLSLAIMARAGFNPHAALTALAKLAGSDHWLDIVDGRRTQIATRMAKLRSFMAPAPPSTVQSSHR